MKNTDSFGRRSFVRGTLAALAAGAATASAAAVTVSALPDLIADRTEPAIDAELLELGLDLAMAWAAEDAAYASDGYDLDAADAASERTSAIVKRINDCPAFTLGGLQVKAAAIAWCHSGNIDLPSAGTDMKMVHSIITDLLRAIPADYPIR